MTMNTSAKEAILKHGLMCRCPRCGKGRLFNGFLKLAPRCEACGLDYSFADPADGPAFFIMIIMGIPAAGFGVWVEIMWEPSVWVHLLTSGPFLLLTCIPPIRIAKGMLVASQYFHKAEEGRFAVPNGRRRTDRQPPAPADWKSDAACAATQPSATGASPVLTDPGCLGRASYGVGCISRRSPTAHPRNNTILPQIKVD